MPPSDLAARLKVLAESAVQPLAPARGIVSELPEFLPGERFSARIEAALGDGSFKALVANRNVTLSLAHPAQAGELLELVVIERTPRAIVARRADATLSSPPDATLSHAARIIGELAAGEFRPVPLARGEPMLPAAPALAAAAAPLLRRAISESGLFYESHQAEWLSGTRPTESLLAEPQGARLPAAAAPQPPEGAAGARIPEELAPLVRSQLEALATHRLVWQGALWPGQSVQWEIEEQPDERMAEGGPEAASCRWVTTLRLVLPHLGEIRARLALAGARIELGIEAATPDARALLRASQPALGRALAADGLALGAVSVTP